MAYYGAQVIHPKTIKPLQNKSIPLYVQSFLHPTAEGTVIHAKMVKACRRLLYTKTARCWCNSRRKTFRLWVKA